jgi:hypothetical protein
VSLPPVRVGSTFACRAIADHRSTSAKGSYGKSPAKPLKRKALTVRGAGGAQVSLHRSGQPPGGFAAGIEWRWLTAAG